MLNTLKTMKNSYFFLLFFIVYIQSIAQTKCSSAQSDLNYAYSHIKSAYESNNLTHLKYYGKRSFDAFERSKKALENCNCMQAYNYSYDASSLLTKLVESETYEDGRFYIKRTRELAKKAIQELDLCSKLTAEDEALAELEYERQTLEEQQKQLKLKEAKIKQLLVDKENRELRLKKETLITTNQQAISSNINAFNDMLTACECDARIFVDSLSTENLLSKNLNEIKSYYLRSIRKVTQDYITSLNQCNSLQN